MKCPNCNGDLRETTTDTGATSYCSECGWTRQVDRQVSDQASGRPEMTGAVLAQLVGGWLFSIALIVGPYIAMHIYLPSIPPWVHLVYWLAMVIYLMAAATTTPTYDDTNLGWFGGMMDNPFSFEDDANRMGLYLALFLLPGKVVAATVKLTWRLARG